MEAPKEIYLSPSIAHPRKPSQVWFNHEVANGVKYIRADLAEQPETNLLEEAYMRGFAQGAKEEREAFTPLINRLCEAILFEWKDAADLARKTLIQIKAQEE